MKRYHARIHTSYGLITVELIADKAEATVRNFEQYVKDGFYDNTLIHRVIDNFIIQGGGFEPGLIQKTTRPPIKNESEHGLPNKRGTIAMARLDGESDSATSQFFINMRDNEVLDFKAGDNAKPGYCAFGRVVEGMEVVERIEGVSTTSVGNLKYVPSQEIIVEKVELVRAR